MHKQVSDQIRDAISTGMLAPRTRLPSIREMALELGVSPITVKRAYGDLRSGGYLATRAGLGSFVAELDRGVLRERKAKEIRVELGRLVKAATAFGIPGEEIQRMVDEAKEEIDDSV